jgi:hypothetical protein
MKSCLENSRYGNVKKRYWHRIIMVKNNVSLRKLFGEGKHAEMIVEAIIENVVAPKK